MPGTVAGRAPGLNHLRGALLNILGTQRPDGAIPWFEDGPWDPWNHAECLMALNVMGDADAAAAGFGYLAACQETDGSWRAAYGNALPMDGRLRIARIAAPKVKDSNFAAYPATALWHAFTLHNDIGFVRRYWPMVRAALNFVLRLQHEPGDISWSAEAHGTAVDDALLAGNASIFKSLGHGLKLAALVEDPQPAWAEAQLRLGQAILLAPHRFDRAGASHAGFAMDWYYPVLAGALPLAESRARLRFGQRRFIEDNRGCRCVDTEPWATVAESAELALTLTGLKLGRQAQTLLAWQDAHRDADGAYWMGWQFEENIPWPQEKPSWTQAAAILAYDALSGFSRGAGVLARRDG